MTTGTPAVSVVLPTYDRADVVGRAIESVLAQTYEDFELVVVDDHSSDYTRDLIDRYRDDRIRYIRHDENRGESAARNTGVTASNGEFVTFVDDDDEFHPQLLEKSIATIETHPEDCAGTFVTYEAIHGDGRRDVHAVRETVTSLGDRAWDFIRIGGTMLRSSVFETVGLFDEQLTYTVDSDLWVRLLRRYYLVGIDEPLYRYHNHDDQIIVNDAKIIDGIEQFFRKHESLPRRYEAKLHCTRGHAYARLGEWSNAFEEFERGLLRDPTALPSYYFFVATKLGYPAYRFPWAVVNLEDDPRGVASGLFSIGRERSWEKLAEMDERFGFSERVPNRQNRVLVYHSIGGSGHESIPVERFRDDVAYVSSEYDVVDLPEVVSNDGSEKQVALTIDDGYADFYTNALPVIREFEVPVTVFVNSRSLYDDEFSHDRNAEYQYMTETQFRELVAEELVAIGNHSQTHPDLTAIDSAEILEAEIVGSKTDFEEHLGITPSRFSYPYTWYDSRSVEAVRRSHDVGVVGADWTRMEQRQWDPHLIPRVNGAQERHLVRWELTDLAGKFATAFSSLQ